MKTLEEIIEYERWETNIDDVLYNRYFISLHDLTLRYGDKKTQMELEDLWEEGFTSIDAANWLFRNKFGG